MGGLIWWSVVLSVALAAPEVLPSVEPEGVEEAYRAYALSQARSGLRGELACRGLAPGLRLCFRSGEIEGVGYVTQSHLTGWGETLPQVEARALHASLRGFGVDRPAPVTVEGMTGRYWMSAEDDQLDHAGMLYPDRLAAIAGENPVVGVPARGILVFWVPGDADFDKVVAVGVKRLYEEAQHAVSPDIFRWNGNEWVLWASVQPTEPAAP
jgi:hypothetical protein